SSVPLRVRRVHCRAQGRPQHFFSHPHGLGLHTLYGGPRTATILIFRSLVCARTDVQADARDAALCLVASGLLAIGPAEIRATARRPAQRRATAVRPIVHLENS